MTMKTRIHIGRFLIRLGNFISSLAVVVMRPKQLIEFSRASYADPGQLASFCDDPVVGRGLNEREKSILSAIPLQSGSVLVLGSGGGREAVALAKDGFSVTAVDYLPAMIEATVANAKKAGVKVFGSVQEISCLEMPAGSFDLAWLSAGMYSCVPTRRLRVKMLRRVAAALKPGGHFAAQMIWRERPASVHKAGMLRRIFAWLTLGNVHHEPGDRVWNDREFMHVFSDSSVVKAEVEDGGFDLIQMQTHAEEAAAILIARKKSGQ